MSTLQINFPSENLILPKSYLHKYLENRIPWTLFLSQLLLKKIYMPCSWQIWIFTNLLCSNESRFSLAINYCSSKQAKQLSRNIKKSLLNALFNFLITQSYHILKYIYQHKGCLFKILLCNKLPTCPLCKLIFHPKILFCQNYSCKCILKTAFYEQYELWIINQSNLI